MLAIGQGFDGPLPEQSDALRQDDTELNAPLPWKSRLLHFGICLPRREGVVHHIRACGSTGMDTGNDLSAICIYAVQTDEAFTDVGDELDGRALKLSGERRFRSVAL
jgi:hypothetical protein